MATAHRYILDCSIPLTRHVYRKELFTIEIMQFIRPTRGHGGPYTVKVPDVNVYNYIHI